MLGSSYAHVRNQVGIVSKISTLLANNNCNIIESKQFTDQDTNNFFIRQSFKMPIGLEIETINKEFKTLSNILNSKYEIIAGERRWLAARKAGLHDIPVVVTEADDLKSLEFAIVENVQRHDLNPLEEAQGYKRLIDEFSYDQEKVSKFIGKSRSYITNSLRLLNLPADVLNYVEQRKISPGHAKILVGLDNASFIASKIIEKKLSVRQSETFVKLFKKKLFSLRAP